MYVQWSLNARLEPKVKQLNQRTMTEENSATLYYKTSKQGQCTCNYSDSTGAEFFLTHYSGRMTQICVFNTVKLGTSASSP